MAIWTRNYDLPTGPDSRRGWLYSIALVSTGYAAADQAVGEYTSAEPGWTSNYGVGTEEDAASTQYEIAIAYDEFDISSIPQNATITAATLSGKLKEVQDTGGSFYLEAYERYYGSSLQMGDWLRGSSVQSIYDGGSEAARIHSSSWTSDKYYDFTNRNIISLLQYRVTQGQSAWQIMVTTNKQRQVNTPATNTGRAFIVPKVANDPFKLEVTYHVPDGPEAMTLGVAM